MQESLNACIWHMRMLLRELWVELAPILLASCLSDTWVLSILTFKEGMRCPNTSLLLFQSNFWQLSRGVVGLVFFKLCEFLSPAAINCFLKPHLCSFSFGGNVKAKLSPWPCLPTGSLEAPYKCFSAVTFQSTCFQERLPAWKWGLGMFSYI